MTYRVPPRLGWVPSGAEAAEPWIYLMPLPNGTPVLLEGWAATLWMAAVDDQLDGIWEARADDPMLREGAEAFLRGLLARGLLQLQEEES